MRLFLVACCRRIPFFTQIAELRNLADTVERYVDRQATAEELTAARKRLEAICWNGKQRYFADAVACLSTESPRTDTEIHSALAALERYHYGQIDYRSSLEALFLCINSNCYGIATVSPGLLRWNDGLLAAMARQIYESRDFSAMPILADALEEAGYENSVVLAHCREPGPHARGCFVLDMLMERG